jgi:hypothetical protein
MFAIWAPIPLLQVAQVREYALSLRLLVLEFVEGLLEEDKLSGCHWRNMFNAHNTFRENIVILHW